MRFWLLADTSVYSLYYIGGTSTRLLLDLRHVRPATTTGYKCVSLSSTAPRAARSRRRRRAGEQGAAAQHIGAGALQGRGRFDGRRKRLPNLGSKTPDTPSFFPLCFLNGNPFLSGFFRAILMDSCREDHPTSRSARRSPCAASKQAGPRLILLGGRHTHVPRPGSPLTHTQ